ncbi:MAG TPA: phosphatase PAP2 family protein [Xanthobacteraceae bacterium]|nr:phosphatase PAP2 family protein [Xanthobacteraceae bacterium]
MLILATGLLIALAFGLYPKLDLSISAAFYDRVQHDWPITRNDLLILHRNVSAYLAAILVIFAIGAIAFGAIRRGRPALISWRAASFLIGSLLLGPGLIVNVLLKPEWARPRPADVIDFGGKLHFVPWWNPLGECDGNCSFVSGETSLAFWMLAFAIILPQRYRAVAIVAVLVNCLLLGAGRIAMGGHFTSDVLLAVVLTALAMWLVHRIAFADLAVFRRSPPRGVQQPENGGIGPRAPLSRNA